MKSQSKHFASAQRRLETDWNDTRRSGGGTVDFQEFVAGLSAFSNRGAREEKLRCQSFVFSTLIHVEIRGPLVEIEKDC